MEKRKMAETVVKGKTGAAVQRAIDSLAAAGGGRVVLDGGVYESGTIYLRSGIELHIAEGTVLRGAATPDGYDDIDDPRIDRSPEKSKKVFIACLDGTDIAITGGGVIDGQGVGFYDANVPSGARHFAKPDWPRTRMIQFYRCRGVRIEGVTLKDSPGWTCWFRMCEDIAIEGATVAGDQRMINNDGLDFDGCRRISVRKCRLRTGDDCVVVRAITGGNGESSLCEDVSVEDCDLDSSCQCVRLGCPSDGLIRRIRFSRIRMRGNNGIMSFHPYRYLRQGTRGGFAMEDAVFEDCDIDVDASPLFFDAEPGIEIPSFGHVALRGCTLKGRQPIRLTGTAVAPLSDVRLERCKVRIAAETPFEIKCIDGLSLDGTEIASGLGEPPAFAGGGKTDSWESV